MAESSNTVMVITPHPDDAEYGTSGTVAKWVAEGREVIYVVCTNGDKGSSDPDMTSERLARIRRHRPVDKVARHSQVAVGHQLSSALDNRRRSASQTRDFRSLLSLG